MPLGMTSCEGTLGTGDKKLWGRGSLLEFPKLFPPGSARRKPAAYQLGVPGCTPQHYSAPRTTAIFSLSSLHCVVACSCPSQGISAKSKWLVKSLAHKTTDDHLHFWDHHLWHLRTRECKRDERQMRDRHLSPPRRNNLASAQWIESTWSVLRVSRLKTSQWDTEKEIALGAGAEAKSWLKVWVLSESNESMSHCYQHPVQMFH